MPRSIDHLFDPYIGLFRALLHERGGIRIDSGGLKGAGIANYDRMKLPLTIANSVGNHNFNITRPPKKNKKCLPTKILLLGG